MHPVNPLNGNAAYSIILLCLERHIILLCLTLDNFTPQGECAVTQCVTVIPMSLKHAPHLTL